MIKLTLIVVLQTKNIMKKFELLFISLAIITASCTNQDNKTLKLPETDKEKLGYSFGLEYAVTMKNEGMDSIIDINFFFKAFEDVFQGDSLDISKEEGEEILNEYFEMIQKNMMEKQLSDNKKLVEESSDGEEIILASGVKIIILEDVDGPSPQLSDTVTTEIRIMQVDGTLLQEFDEPQTFVLSQVFPGLTEGIQLMSIGDTWNLIIPPELGMAVNDPQTLLFEVKLLEIN